MAGGFGSKFDPAKFKIQKNGLSNEFDHQASKPSSSPDSKTFSIRGILGLGQSIELSRPSRPAPEKILLGPSHLEQELVQLESQEKAELKKIIEQLQDEIKSMKAALGQLDKSTEILIETPVIEINAYQLNFLSRLRLFISSLAANINQANLWLESFNQKKKKKNYFWSMAQNKKKGGQQYMFSNEHSAARSGT